MTVLSPAVVKAVLTYQKALRRTAQAYQRVLRSGWVLEDDAGKEWAEWSYQSQLALEALRTLLLSEPAPTRASKRKAAKR